MDCAEEVSLLRARLSRVPGVRDLRFDVVNARMDVEYSPSRVTPDQIIAAVASVGMRCEPWGVAERQQRAFWQRRGKQAAAWTSGLALTAGMAVESLESGDPIRSILVHEHAHHDLPRAAMALFLLAILAGAAYALPKAWNSLRSLRPDMNLLVVMSMAGASALGEWTEAATLSFLFALAGRLESWSLARARDAISRLLSVAPPEAAVLHGDHEHRVPVDRVDVGSTVRVRPGERVPFDGSVLTGSSYVNQALITGESVAVEKDPGDEVFAGSMNESGTLDIRTTHRSADTTLARMIRMVEESQTRRAPSEQFVERFTRFYTPGVLLLAFSVSLLPPLLHGGAWDRWFYEGMVILLIACPCALVISTPVSIVAALAAAARHGVLVKGGAFLEEAARLRIVAMSRQGVLTRGRPEPAGSVVLDHEPAQAMRAWLRRREHAGESWPVTPRTLLEGGVHSGALPQAVAQLSDEGWTIDAREEPGGLKLVGLCDHNRGEARLVIQDLRARGVERTVLLTGDPPRAARTAAEAAGIDEIHSELLPEDKAAHVRELMRTHRHVAMVGDGLNDAQALAAASLGVSMAGRGTDLARETADVVLMTNDISRLVFLVDHSRRTLRVVKQNIWFALATKALFLAAAFGGVATLWMAVAADMGATFAVTLNGLRLLRSRPHQKK